MPQFISDKGEWSAADLAAEAELKVRGVKTLGVKVKPKTETGTQPYPVMAEAQNELPKVGADNKFPEMRKRGSAKPKKEG